MPIELRDITNAVAAYLNTKVKVQTAPPAPVSGATLNPSEGFKFGVIVENANAAAGGVALKNLRYRVSVDDPAVATILVPASGRATDLNNAPLAAGAEVGALIFTPASGNTLAVGQKRPIVFDGKAGDNPLGGSTVVRAAVLADVDLDLLFARGSGTPQTGVTVDVVG